MSIILAVYFVLIGFVSAFAISPWLPIPLLISFLLAVLFLLKIIQNNIKIPKIYSIGLLYIFLVIMLLSYYFQIATFGTYRQGFTHLLSYFVVIWFFYVIIYFSLCITKFKIKQIFRFISIGVLFASLFAVIEFILKNMLGFNIDDFIYRPVVEQMLATYTIGGETFIRARSVAEEPTHFAMYLVMFSSFVVYYYKFYVKNNIKLYISILLMVTALFATFSAAGFFVVVASSILTGIFYCLFTKKIRISLKHTAAGFIFLISMVYISIQHRVLDGILAKLFFIDISSALNRVQRWTNAWELFYEKPIIGWGPGITSILRGTGSTNLYLEIATQVGIIGLIILVLIFLNFFRIIFKIKGNVKYAYLFSLISVSIYFVSMSNYWFPWVWGLFAIIGYQYYLQSQKKSEV